MKEIMLPQNPSKVNQPCGVGTVEKCCTGTAIPIGPIIPK
ncbi:hypothetical protein EDD65_10823 [Keratinibaculum paraultunense]|uniref:Uncharacterized protein n=1 Tax=Keratinibaculum paraultunense TaxID=1278232 RepID=A0A4R3KX45_9FIRM|nr:hypothetical protein EDD65_10823 [Keratinibaculum paraultunense]